MTVFQTCLLLYCTLAGTFFAAFSPARRLSKRKATMSPEELTSYNQQKNEFGLSHSCVTSLVGMWQIAHLYLVEPLYVIWAISIPIEPRGLAYVALCIIVIRTFLLFASFVVSFPKTSNETRFSWGYWIGAVVWSLPTLYLWFLLAVVIGLV